jgi:hypothetical protein
MSNMPNSATDHESMRRWVRTWQTAGEELDRIKIAELRAVTEEQAAQQSHDLFRMGDQWLDLNPGLRRESGLVEQQRWFMKWREQSPT